MKPLDRAVATDHGRWYLENPENGGTTAWSRESQTPIGSGSIGKIFDPSWCHGNWQPQWLVGVCEGPKGLAVLSVSMMLPGDSRFWGHDQSDQTFHDIAHPMRVALFRRGVGLWRCVRHSASGSTPAQDIFALRECTRLVSCVTNPTLWPQGVWPPEVYSRRVPPQACISRSRSSIPPRHRTARARTESGWDGDAGAATNTSRRRLKRPTIPADPLREANSSACAAYPQPSESNRSRAQAPFRTLFRDFNGLRCFMWSWATAESGGKGVGMPLFWTE